MAGKAPLLLAAFLFAIGLSGLLAIDFADRAQWGPFRPGVQPPAPHRVIVIDVATPFTPPALEALFTSAPERSAQALAAEPAPAPEPAAAGTPAPTPTPIPPIRIHGVAAEDGVSAAGATPTPPPPIRIINIAVGEEPSPTPEDPAPEATPGG